MKETIPLFKVFMSPTAKDKAGEVLDSGYIGQGSKVDEFEKQIGLVKINGRNLEQWLNHIAKDPRVIASVKEMNNDRRRDEIEYDPTKSYYHNNLIKKRFNLVRSIAWGRVRNLPEAQALIKKKGDLEGKMNQKL